MNNLSSDFEIGIGLLNLKQYQKAINYFKRDLEQNPKNFAALHNIGLAKIYLGVKNKNQASLKDAIQLIKESIILFKNLYPNGGDYFIAEGNLDWANEELKKL